MTKLKLPQNQQFCFCHDGVSLQMVSGGAAKEGYLGRVTLKIDGEYVDYVKAQKSNEQVEEPLAYQNIDLPNKVVSLEDWEDIDPMWHMMYRPLFAHPPVPTAQPKEPEQEPVVAKHYFFEYVGFGKWAKCNKETYDKTPEMERLSVYTHSQNPQRSEDINLSCKSTQARLAASWGYVKAEPLTDEEIIEIRKQGIGYDLTKPFGWTLAFARAIEAAHGIKE